LSRVIVFYLRHAPLTWEPVENLLSYHFADALMTIFPENEKLCNRTNGISLGFI
jgi:hypothetical protein